MGKNRLFFLDVISGILFKDNIGIDNANSLKNKILDKEQYILNLPQYDGFGGVIENSITYKHNSYNLLDFGWPEVDLICSKIKIFTDQITDDNVYVKMWGNIYRSGEYISKHTHMGIEDKSQYPNVYSGHCFLYSTQPTTTTFYFGPVEENVVDLENVEGQIDIFSMFTPHEFKKWDGGLRVGLAFDIVIGDKDLKYQYFKHVFKKI
jgi:hypothetical protein